jgi:hypothetical protein
VSSTSPPGTDPERPSPVWPRRALTLAGAAAGLAALLGYMFWSVSYYPPDLFAGLKARTLPEDGAAQISVHVMGNIFCVGRLDHRQLGDELNVRMRYRLICPKQRSGDFSIRIEASGPVRRITYGEERMDIGSNR